MDRGYVLTAVACVGVDFWAEGLELLLVLNSHLQVSLLSLHLLDVLVLVL